MSDYASEGSPWANLWSDEQKPYKAFVIHA